MTNRRASVFDDEADIDLSGFQPKPRAGRGEEAPAEAIRAVSEQAQFKSREPAPPVERKPQRRHRTGRNRQINFKASDETINEFYAVTDAQGWMLAETLERALAALKRELSENS